MARDIWDGSGEDRLIARYFRPLAKHPGAFGFLDDAAAIAPPPGHDLVLKTDGLIAGVHFFPDDPAGDVARKALRVNLSDLAAKGARPLGFLLSIALPKDFREAWLAAFTAGLGADADAYGCPLLGGDTDATPGPITLYVAAFGTLPSGTIVRRAGARTGDHLFVSGTIGDAALGLRVRRDDTAGWNLDAAMCDHLVARFRLPQPRTALAEAVRRHASAAMDVSDGLAADLGKLCHVSGAAADIDIAHVPLSAAARAALAADASLIESILTGGEDYEILCTVPPAARAAFVAEAAAADTAVTEIGRIVPGNAPPRFLDAAGRPAHFVNRGYSHF